VIFWCSYIQTNPSKQPHENCHILFPHPVVAVAVAVAVAVVLVVIIIVVDGVVAVVFTA
jgi:hypothetical protein